jgi:predicted nucleic acid-binding protein
MRFVLDASVVITWAMRDEDHPAADLAFQRIQTESAIVPAIWWYEVRNILLVNERRNRISLPDSARFLADLSDFDIEVRPPENSQRTIDLARQHNLSVYDAAYLALAMEQKAPLATLDDALRSAAQFRNVALVA